ncbi:MFS transporter [Paracoccaceae bacterium]|nr:MFS transporter [Paracoccaceae bacterium]
MNKDNRRTILALTLAQAVLGSQMPMYIILGGLVGQSLASSACYATLPISLIIIGSMISSPILSNLMQSTTRKFGLLLGNLAGLIGSLTSLLGIFTRSFEVFLLGSFISGAYMASQAFYRFTATDVCEDQFKARAISFVLTGGLIAAILGPSLIKLSLNINKSEPFLYSYLAIVILNCFGPFILSFVNPQSSSKSVEESKNNDFIRGMEKSNRSSAIIFNSPAILVSISCSMIAYGVMNLIMTSSPIAIVGCGFGANLAASVVSAHALAMFAPSFITGKLIEKYGEKSIISSGMTLFLLAIFIAYQGIDIWNFYVSLILIGIGWNFGFIGSTSLLTKSHHPSERGKVQGINDFFVFGFVALSSITSGWLMNCSSSSSQLGWNIINLTATPLIIFALISITILSLFDRSKFVKS